MSWSVSEILKPLKKNSQSCVIRFKNCWLRLKFLNLILHFCLFFTWLFPQLFTGAVLSQRYLRQMQVCKLFSSISPLYKLNNQIRLRYEYRHLGYHMHWDKLPCGTACFFPESSPPVAKKILTLLLALLLHAWWPTLQKTEKKGHM